MCSCVKRMIGRRASSQRSKPDFGSYVEGPAILCSSADLDAGIGQEFIRRHVEIARRRPDAHPSCRIVLRAVAMAEPAAVIALLLRGRVGLRGAAEMRADADEHK